MSTLSIILSNSFKIPTVLISKSVSFVCSRRANSSFISVCTIFMLGRTNNFLFFSLSRDRIIISFVYFANSETRLEPINPVPPSITILFKSSLKNNYPSI